MFSWFKTKEATPYDPVIGNMRNPVPPEFNDEMLNKRFEYTYNNGWTYKFWVPSEERIVYSIHGGPMAGRYNYQTTYYQRIRKNLWQVNFLEETGTVVSIVVDVDERKITTFIAFSKGHWEQSEASHGNKRNPDDLKRWRGLLKLGIQTSRFLVPEQATIDLIAEGPGELEPIDLEVSTF